MKKLMAIGAILLLVGSLAYMIFSDPHIPLLDANRQVLAESARQGYCAGQGFNYNQPNSKAVQDCMETATHKSDETDHSVVQRNACEGAGVPAANVAECEQWMKDNQYWFTMQATLTNSWNRAFPYPLANNIITQESNESRTGDRDENTRNEGPAGPSR